MFSFLKLLSLHLTVILVTYIYLICCKVDLHCFQLPSFFLLLQQKIIYLIKTSLFCYELAEDSRNVGDLFKE